MYSHADAETMKRFIAEYMPSFTIETGTIQEVSKEVTECILKMQKNIFGEDGKPNWRQVESIRDDNQRKAVKKGGATERAWYKTMLRDWFKADEDWLKTAKYTDLAAAFRSAVVNSIYANIDSLH